jgi:uncharacterized membrane protein YozB (DUF420 family)
LNAASACFLGFGYYFIRTRNIKAHRNCMVSAFVTSCLFLISYLTYHAMAGSTRFTAQGWIRPVYFTILGTHTVLAAAMVPMILITLSRALRERFDRHKVIAVWTWPVWVYVSVTGVVIYVMLYHLYPSA